tara:strand:- start:4084 stop:4191 length:108 start_codon:yes stop_codon:yes gene_type:complete
MLFIWFHRRKLNFARAKFYRWNPASKGKYEPNEVM